MAARRNEEVNIARRNFLRLSFAGMALGLVPAATTVAGIKFLWGPRQTTAEWLDVGQAADFNVGDVKLFAAGEVYVTRIDEGFLAISQRSPHMRCKVAWLADRQEFASPCDGSTFDSKGEVIRGPAPRPLGTHVMRLENGVLQVKVGDKNVRKRDKFRREQVNSLA